MLLDRGRERAQVLPFGDFPHFAVAAFAQRPKPIVVLFLMERSGQEPLRRFGLIDWPAASLARAARLRLDAPAIVPCRLGHACAPFRICAI